LFPDLSLLGDTESGGTDIATLVRRAVAEVRSVLVLLVLSFLVPCGRLSWPAVGL